jgi:hypothetical protein
MAIGGSGCGGSESSSRSTRPAATSHGEGTRVVYVRPTTRSGSLKPRYRVSARLSDGLCIGSSVFVTGVAYSCRVRTSGYHQCWPLRGGAGAGEVFCVGKPWEHSGIEIGLQERLQPSVAESSTHRRRGTWGVELTTGQRCVHLNGALGAFHGVTVEFDCTGTNLYLLGTPDQAQAFWTIREVVNHPEKEGAASASPGSLGRIAVAWYGEGAST